MPGPFKASQSGATDPATPPSATSESKAAGAGLSNKTFGAFTGPGAADIDSYSVSNVQAAGSCTWSGSGLGPYAPSDSDGDAGTLYLDALDSSGNVLGRAVHSYDRASPGGGGGASWTTLWEVDFTTNITDKVFTRNGGDEILYEADGTTPKATIRFADRVAGAGGSLVCTAAAGGLLLTTTGSGGDSQFGAIEIPEGAGIDFDDGKLYAFDMLIDTVEHGANGAYVLCGIGNNNGGINSGFNLTHRHQRVSAISWTQSARTRYGSTSDVGATLTSDVLQPTENALRLIADRGGDLLDLYFNKSASAYLSGTPRPTPSASLWNGAGGTGAIATDDSFRFSGASAWAFIDNQVYGGTMTTRLLKLRVQRLD